MTALANPDVDYALLVVAANAGLSESGKVKKKRKKGRANRGVLNRLNDSKQR